jgi:hypothetical protein
VTNDRVSFWLPVALVVVAVTALAAVLRLVSLRFLRTPSFWRRPVPARHLLASVLLGFPIPFVSQRFGVWGVFAWCVMSTGVTGVIARRQVRNSN